MKQIAKEILTCKETTIVGYFSKGMGKLGRSLIIVLETKGFKNVDHRTIKCLIVKNVKYTVGR